MTGHKVSLAPIRGDLRAGVRRAMDCCAICLVRGCALVGALVILVYSLTRLSFIKINSVNRNESLYPVIQKCRIPWQDLFNRYVRALYVMSSGAQGPVGREWWVIVSMKGPTSA